MGMMVRRTKSALVCRLQGAAHWPTPRAMLIARTVHELEQARAALRAAGVDLALVPTMGALHAGHLDLLRMARDEAGAVAASVFVNPLQFGPGEDFARYPRDEAADLAALRDAGCDLAWLPGLAEMYPDGDATTIDVAGPAMLWEGAVRPGHFRGVATVVAKLFGQVRPRCAVFGEKDWQQLQVIRRMVADLALPVRVAGAPTRREPDGLAMSSRNRFFTVQERRLAPLLYGTLGAVRAALSNGVAAPSALNDARAQLIKAGFVLDYLALVDGATLREVIVAGAGARLIAAARLGRVRLLDNIAVG